MQFAFAWQSSGEAVGSASVMEHSSTLEQKAPSPVVNEPSPAGVNDQ